MDVKIDRRLQAHIEGLVKGFHGEVGVYVKDLRRGTIASVRADELFPTASIVKIPILIGILDKLEKRELDYHQKLTYTDDLLYEGEDILGSFKSKEKIELSKLIMLMLTTSDNTASLWLQTLAGGGLRINRILAELGYSATRVNSRTDGRKDAQVAYGWGQTSPREIADIMERIATGRLLSPESSERMLRCLGRNYWDEEAIGQIPPDVFIASKNGAVNQSRSEVLFVKAPNNPYVFSIITRNQKDQSWGNANEGWVLARTLSRDLWRHYEPKSAWKASQALAMGPAMPSRGGAA
jgi:beta-lactamase class A